LDEKNILVKPAPWQLSGHGFILVYGFSRAYILENGFIPASLSGNFCGGPSVVILVNYQCSAVGPYNELLFIPGRFNYAGRQYSSITRIYVSTEASVINGRKNWAIPKERADFDWQTDDDGFERIRISQDHIFADFSLKPAGPTLPVSSALIPAGWRTLMQPVDTHLLFTKLQSSGKVKIARCLNSAVDGSYFPNLSQGRLLAAGKVSQFDMVFPIAMKSP
jgi:hypothetical protein